MYFHLAVNYKKIDFEYIPVTNGKAASLLARNIQKRLDIGIGVELLIKSLYLRENFIINLVRDKRERMKDFPFQQSDNFEGFHKDQTFTLNDLIQNLNKVQDFKNIREIELGLRIAKVFRNKEGHVVTSSHEYHPDDYSRIERSLCLFYKEAFDQKLEIQFSIEGGEQGVWSVNP